MQTVSLYNHHYLHINKFADLSLRWIRITPGPQYLETLCQDNVNVVPQRIVGADATGVIAADGVHRECDAIIVSSMRP